MKTLAAIKINDFSGLLISTLIFCLFFDTLVKMNFSQNILHDYSVLVFHKNYLKIRISGYYCSERHYHEKQSLLLTSKSGDFRLE